MAVGAILVVALLGCFGLSATSAEPSAERYVFWLQYGSFSTIHRQGLSSSVPSVIYNSSNSLNHLAVDEDWVYWGEGWAMCRCRHDGSKLNTSWLQLNNTKYGYGLVYNMVVFQRTLYYQTQANYDLYALHLDTLTVEDLGNFRYAGNGGMNGDLAARSVPNSTHPVQLFWGVDQGESPTLGGCEVSWSSPQSPPDPRTVWCGVPFPRGLAVTSDGSGLLTPSASSDYALNWVDIESGFLKYSFPPPQGLEGKTMTSVTVVDSDAALVAFSSGIYHLALDSSDFGNWSRFRVDAGQSVGKVRIAPWGGSPHLQDINPTSGPQAGGTKLYLWGSGFLSGSGAACLFGGVVSSAATVLTPEHATCVVPPSPVAGTSAVRVSNDGVHWSTESVDFTYKPTD